jgi:NADH-quinone oxidoreductase subunit J
MVQVIVPTLLLAQSPQQLPVPMAPAVFLVLCIVGGVGTVLLLPSRRETPLRKVGAAILIAAVLVFAALLVRWKTGPVAGVAGMNHAFWTYFWIFSAIAIFGAIRVVTHTKPVYSALYFVLTVFASAGLFLLVQAEFMAAALILIYAGAILITYVFVIMLAAEATSGGSSALRGGSLLGDVDNVSRDPVFASAVGFALMGVMLFVIFDKYHAITQQPPQAMQAASILAPGTAADPAGQGPTQRLGSFLFTNQLINLELAGLILTLAMVGAIVIARRNIVAETADTTPTPKPNEVVLGPATPINDDPHSIPVYGTTNPRQKAYPET